MRKSVSCLLWMAMTMLFIAPVFADQLPGPGYGPHMWQGGWYGWLFGPIMMIVFIAVAVVVVMLLVRWLGGGSVHGNVLHSPLAKTPLDILKERFAKGEIDKEEFEERRRVLGE